MRRRDLIKGIAGSAIAWPLAAHVQQAQSVRRIGVLMNLSESDPEGQSRMAAVRDGLRKLGWIEGRNLQVESRWGAGDSQRIRAYAAELVAMKPSVIFASAASVAVALQRETRTVPIVFAQTIDPVGLGLVASISQPGGNITGFALYEFAIAAHWVELLKQFAPNLTRVAAMYDDAASPAAVGLLPMTNAGARMQGVEVATYAVRNEAEIVQAIEAFAREPGGGLIPLPSELIAVKRELIISLAAKHRLPNIYAFRYYPESGGLASYGVDNIDTYRRAADYIDRILKGEKPADLPVQFPTKYQLVINLKTAKALGLTVPDKLLVSADEVIE
jgi:putative tryptophan/tyrosine transport system substrate-binding protein